MAYCAVGLKTESGDDYIFLIEYRNLEDVTKYILDALGEEAAYVYDYNVDTGVSSDEDKAVKGAVSEAIDQAKYINDEEE